MILAESESLAAAFERYAEATGQSRFMLPSVTAATEFNAAGVGTFYGVWPPGMGPSSTGGGFVGFSSNFYDKDYF